MNVLSLPTELVAVMLKASEGGGGKGIRMSSNDEELRVNFEMVKAEVQDRQCS